MDNYPSLQLIDRLSSLWLIDQYSPLVIEMELSGHHISEADFSHFISLYTIDKQPISLKTIESFKEYPQVVSVTYLVKLKGHGVFDNYLQCLPDNFTVRLRKSSDYAKMEELAERYNCRIVKNKDGEDYTIYVCKTSKFDAMQTAAKFYESELFVFALPLGIGTGFSSLQIVDF
jgi:hypothetical protein